MLAQLGEVEQAEELARELLDMLQEDSIEEARAQVLERIQQGIDSGDRNAVLKMARYQQQIVDEPDPGQIYVWYAVAAALDIKGRQKPEMRLSMISTTTRSSRFRKKPAATLIRL